MDPLPERPNLPLPPPPPETPKYVRMGRYGNDMSIITKEGYTYLRDKYGQEQTVIVDASKRWSKIGDDIVERDSDGRALRLKNEKTGEVREIQKWAGIPYAGKDVIEGDTSWLG